MYEIPENIRETYIQRRIDDVGFLTEELGRHSVEGFNRVGHQLAGNAANFGYTDLEAIAAEMENLTRNDLAHKGFRLLSEFKDWVETQAKLLHRPPDRYSV